MHRCIAPILIAIFVLASGLAVAAPAQARYLAPITSCSGQTRTDLSEAQETASLRCLINYARSRRGMVKLRNNAELARSAESKASDLTRCNQFSHTACGTGWLSAFAQAGYTSPTSTWSVGENLAWGTGSLASPREVMRSWLNSPPHRANLFTRSFRDQGLALRRDASYMGNSGASVWVLHLGTR